MTHSVRTDNFPLAQASEIENGLSARQRLLPESMANSYPRSRLLQRLSQSRIVRTIAHPVMKTCCGVVTLTGLVSLYLGVHHGELMRDHFDESVCAHLVDYGLIAAGSSAGAWLTSTGLSTALLPRRDSVAVHISASIGYALGGILLVPLGLCLGAKCCNENGSASNQEAGPANRQDVDVQDPRRSLSSLTHSNSIGEMLGDQVEYQERNDG